LRAIQPAGSEETWRDKASAAQSLDEGDEHGRAWPIARPATRTICVIRFIDRSEGGRPCVTMLKAFFEMFEDCD
jgi:hypothetical protein